MPGGGTVTDLNTPTINEAGAVAFLVGPTADYPNLTGAYLWEQGTLTRLAVAGMEAPGGGKFASITGVFLNDLNHTALISARFKRGALDLPDSLYRSSAGTLSPVVVPGQEMPGGGKFKTLQWFGHGISAANEAGQHASSPRCRTVPAPLTCWIPMAHSLCCSRVACRRTWARSPASAARYTETLVTGVGLNDKGQVALPVRISGGKDSIVLLTPASP